MSDRRTRPFVYNAPFYTVTAAGSAGAIQNYPLNFQSDSDFEVQKIMCASANVLTTLAADTYQSILEATHFSGLLVQITDEGSGRRWSDVPVSIPNLFGTGQTPFVLPQTIIVAKNTVLNVQLTNMYTGYSFAYVNFSFFGRKIYL